MMRVIPSLLAVNYLPPYDIGNPDLSLGQVHNCGGVKPVNGIPTLPFDNWVS
jgi:hypothetical protein